MSKKLSRAALRAKYYSRIGLSAWRHSLRMRVAATTVAVGMLALAVLAVALSAQVRDGLFEQRQDQILADAATRAAQAQNEFNSATVSTAQEVQQLAQDAVSRMDASAVDVRGALLLRSPDPTSQVIILAPATDNSLRSVITQDLREKVRADQFQEWQSVALPQPDGTTVPGIAVGAPVTIPVAGNYELYIVYSLASEQEKLVLLQRVLAVGAGFLIALLLIMTWYLTRQVLDPVQRAAKTAERLADGKLTERMRVRGHDELATLGKSFNEMAASLQSQIEKLAELSRMQQQFVSDVSHELRTPLTTVRMAAELLYQGKDDFPPAQKRSTELLHTQLDRFEALLADLLEISRFDAGAAVLDVEALDPADVIERVVALTEPLARERGSEIVTELPADLGRIDADSRRIERILRNLLVNAVEHGEGHDIHVVAAGSETAVSIIVRDSGIGMTAVQAQHVFDRFWRADPSRKRTLGGTGLGLAIALEDARLHGGTLQAWGRPGLGATFRLTVPRRAGLKIGEPPLRLQPRASSAPSPQSPTSDNDGPAAMPYWTSGEES